MAYSVGGSRFQVLGSRCWRSVALGHSGTLALWNYPPAWLPECLSAWLRFKVRG